MAASVVVSDFIVRSRLVCTGLSLARSDVARALTRDQHRDRVALGFEERLGHVAEILPVHLQR